MKCWFPPGEERGETIGPSSLLPAGGIPLDQGETARSDELGEEKEAAWQADLSTRVSCSSSTPGGVVHKILPDFGDSSWGFVTAPEAAARSLTALGPYCMGCAGTQAPTKQSLHLKKLWHKKCKRGNRKKWQCRAWSQWWSRSQTGARHIPAYCLLTKSLCPSKSIPCWVNTQLPSKTWVYT